MIGTQHKRHISYETLQRACRETACGRFLRAQCQNFQRFVNAAVMLTEIEDIPRFVGPNNDRQIANAQAAQPSAMLQISWVTLGGATLEGTICGLLQSPRAAVPIHVRREPLSANPSMRRWPLRVAFKPDCCCGLTR